MRSERALYAFRVSIQPLLLFIQFMHPTVSSSMFVSIQPLLLFIHFYATCLCITIRVSIQPLLLFIAVKNVCRGINHTFQYNPCYCLSYSVGETRSAMMRVSIQPLLLFISFNVGGVKKTFRFNTTLVTVYPSHLKAFNFPSLVLYRIKPDFFNIFPSDSAKFEFFTKSLYFRYFSQYPEFGGW